jgi:hypothetical protein
MIIWRLIIWLRESQWADNGFHPLIGDSLEDIQIALGYKPETSLKRRRETPVHPFDADLNHEATQTAVDDSIRPTTDEIPFLTPNNNSWMEPEVPATTGLAIHTNASDHSGSRDSADWLSQFVDWDKSTPIVCEQNEFKEL